MEKQSGKNEAENCSDQEQISHRKCSCGTSTFKKVKWIYITLFSLLCNIVFIVLFVIVFRELSRLNVKCMDRTLLSSSHKTLRLHFSTVPPHKSNGADVNSDFAKMSETANTTVRPSDASKFVTLLKEQDEQHTTGRLNRRSTDNSPKPTRPAGRHRKRKKDRNRLRSVCNCRVKKRGPRGFQGRPGMSGMPGAPGQRGLQGMQGPQGLKGDQGLQGPPGLQGQKGDIGEKGQIGKRGPPGPKGGRGEKGDRGARGLKGEKGEMGSLESNPRPSAHLTGQTKTSSHLETGILRHWQDTMDYSHSFGGMRHINGDLIIPKQGRYYVYSQLYFQSDKDQPHLVHFMHHTPVNGTRVVIMRSITTKCKDNKLHLFSSYQGGVFELQTGDKLTVGVTKSVMSSLSMADTASFFGAFMI